MNTVKTHPDVVGVLLGMAGGMAIVCPVMPGLVIDYDKLLSTPVAFLIMITAASSLGKVILHYTNNGARIAAIVGIVMGWYLLYGTLFSHSLQF